MKFRSFWRPGIPILTLALILSGVGLLTPAVIAQNSPSEPSLRANKAGVHSALVAGAAWTTLPETTLPEEYIGDKVQVRLNARAEEDHAAHGNFAVTHRTPDGELVADGRGNIDCMRTEGNYAVATGTVTDVSPSDVPEEELSEGMSVAIVVQDSGNGSGADSMIWRFGDVETSCDEIPAQALPVLPVERGNFVVRD